MAVHHAALAAQTNVVAVSIAHQDEKFMGAGSGKGLHALEYGHRTAGASAATGATGGHRKARFQALIHQRSVATQDTIPQAGLSDDRHVAIAIRHSRQPCLLQAV